MNIVYRAGAMVREQHDRLEWFATIVKEQDGRPVDVVEFGPAHAGPLAAQRLASDTLIEQQRKFDAAQQRLRDNAQRMLDALKAADAAMSALWLSLPDPGMVAAQPLVDAQQAVRAVIAAAEGDEA